MSTTSHAPVNAPTFGRWLKEQRRRLDWTQEQLATKSLCSVATIRKLEANALAPSRMLAEQLAVVLQIPVQHREQFISFARSEAAQLLSPSPGEALSPTVVPSPIAAPAKPAAAAYPLPAPLTGLVGREREVQSGCALLRRPSVRLVTLVGPPGAGKTRLSLALATALKADFADGACFVPLAPISDPALVLSAIAQPLQVRESAGLSLMQSLQEFLRQQNLLLVLDNFEQLVEAAPLISELLAAAPGLKILVSSREALKLYGEYEFPVPPLATPDIHHLPAAALLEMYPAVELFVQRAQAVRTHFAVNDQNAAAIAQICAWLDGLPLAIEMAAAQIKWQTPAHLFAQLRQQLMALTGGPRDLSPRQQTLRGAIDWSYNLLSPVEQALLVALAVVNGGCTAASVAALTDQESTTCELLLSSLVEKHLLQCAVEPTGELRYTMLQMIREYAQAKLSAQGTQARWQAQHARVYREFVAACLSGLSTGETEKLLNRLEREHNNLRSALTWHLTTDPVRGLSFAVLLAKSLWGIRGYFQEGRSWLEKLLAAAPDPMHAPRAAQALPLADYAAAWLAAAQMALGQGDLPAAARFAQTSEALAITLEEDDAVRAALHCRAAVALHQSDYAQATLLYQQALALCQAEKDQQEAAAILNGLGLIAKDQGDYARAHEFHAQSYRLYADRNDAIGMARALTYSSIATYWQGDYARCSEYAQQCIALQSGIGDVLSLTYSREILGMALVKMGRLAEGINLLETCATAFTEMDDRSGVAMVLVDLGQAAYLQQAYAQSLRWHEQAMQIAYTIGDRRRLAFCLEGMAMALIRLAASDALGTAHAQAQFTQAVRFCAAAEALRQRIGAPLPATEHVLYAECRTLAHQRLSSVLYNTAWQQGVESSLDQLVQAITS